MKKSLLIIAAMLLCTAAAAQNSGTSVSTSGGVWGDSSGKARGRTNTSVSKSGQDERGGRWQVSGSFGFDFGDSYIRLSISPQIGYAVTNFLTMGGGVLYDFYNNSDYDYKVHSAGLNLFARGYIAQIITLHVQPEVISTWLPGDRREIAPCVLVGGGLSFHVGGGSFLSAMVYYDVLQHKYSPYGDKLVYSVGYGFRF